jgi:ATPase subunit of ABC transporter with duplicated ATPase domains
VVSHDRRFLDKIIGRLLVFSADGQAQQYLGNYADYRARMERLRAQSKEQSTGSDGVQASGPAARATDSESAAAQPPAGLSKNEQARRQQWIVKTEAEIANLETEKQELLAAMTDPSLTAQARTELARRCSTVDEIIAQKLDQWEKWNLEIEDTEDTT